MKVTHFTNIGIVGLLATALGLAACQPQEAYVADKDSIPIVADHDGTTLAGYLAKPEGDGPFPAVVLMHGCEGLQKNTSHQTGWRSRSRHAALLNDNGYVTLILDSYGPRRLPDCRANYDLAVTYIPMYVNDADPAFDYLAALPFVDKERIGYVGFSLGGVAALHVASNYLQEPRGLRVKRDYAASVAYYPGCGWWKRLSRFDGKPPLLILIGADDVTTPMPPCRALAAHWSDAVEIKVYPNTHHNFDHPISRREEFIGPDGNLHIFEANPEALRDSQEHMLAFFATHLGPAN